MKTYVQESGNMYDEGLNVLFTAYSGGDCGAHPEGVNNPDMQFVHDIGPLCCGMYRMNAPYHHPRLGPDVIQLIPDSSNDMGTPPRGGFFIHGDTGDDVLHNLRDGSDGCIVKSPVTTRLLAYSGDFLLKVVARETDVQST